MQFEIDRDELNLNAFETVSLITSYRKWMMEDEVRQIGLEVEVLQIKHKQSSDVFALKKILKPRNSKDLDALIRQFILERDLNHPNIIKLYSFKETDNELYALYEYVDRSLNKQYKSISEQESAMIILQIAEALEYLHSKYILHRDVSLSNVLITGSGLNIKAKLIDFECAGSLKDIRITQCGSLDSLAPEAIAEQMQNQKVDVWGLGVMMYTLYAKSQPFRVKGEIDDELKYNLTTENIKKCSVKYPQNIPPSIRNLLEKILVTNPILRLTLTQILGNPYFKEYKEKLEENREREDLQRKVAELERELSNQKSKQTKSKEILQLQKRLQKLEQQYRSSQDTHDKQKQKLKETEIECMKLEKERRAMQEYRMNLEKSKWQLNKINHNILLVVEENKKIKQKTVELQTELEFLKAQQEKGVRIERIDSKQSASSLSKCISSGSKQKNRSRNNTKQVGPPLNQSKSSKNLY